MFDALEPLRIKAQKSFLNLLQETNGPGAGGHSHRTATICHSPSLAAGVTSSGSFPAVSEQGKAGSGCHIVNAGPIGTGLFC